MRLTFTVAGHTVEGTVDSALQRCSAVIGWDDDEELPLYCHAERHAHRVDAWECGHDEAQGVIVCTMDNGAAGEVTFDLNEQWSPMLLKMGL